MNKKLRAPETKTGDCLITEASKVTVLITEDDTMLQSHKLNCIS